MLPPSAIRIAYFSMEIALASDMPTYSGGLGVLAGDTLRSFADLRVPAVAVSLVHRRGYFRQTLETNGTQHEHPAAWEPSARLERLPHTVSVEISGRRVTVGAWQFHVRSKVGGELPVLLLDTDLPQNEESDRHITDQLYGGDARYRLSQEIVLGFGGVRMLEQAGYSGVSKIHLNEGHAAFASLELLLQRHGNPQRNEWNFDAVRERCVFTTHTPVAAGHDHFDWHLVLEVCGNHIPLELFRMLGGDATLNMTSLALNLSGFVNGVARRHREVAQRMFPGYDIHGITNGVHSESWTCTEFQSLYDECLPGWRSDPATLRNALSIPTDRIWDAHSAAKARLIRSVAERTGRQLHPTALTLGFARRATAYKRGDLLLTDLDRLRHIASRQPLQIIFAGKAHPQDEAGKAMIARIFAASRELSDAVPIVYLDEYDLELARQLVAGSDVWVNTPEPPLEASGTSGMKAAHNGVPSLSTLDGWWIEGHVEGWTGWAIGQRDIRADRQRDAAQLYEKLENEIAPKFYVDRGAWTGVMRHVIALNASYFNTHRMTQQYDLLAYR
ncbi:MAG TPA: alpha-glucan family phosphorylase [Polyangiales bacterium]|nr:alpha-glucan family phosphorylase [Polyangiales bacterium]